MGSPFEQAFNAAAAIPKPSASLSAAFDAASRPAPKLVTPWENEKAKIWEDASRAYGAFLQGANAVNQTLDIPAAAATEFLEKNPPISASMMLGAAPFVSAKTRAELIGGMMDPRYAALTELGAPEARAVLRPAGAALAATQGYGAVRQARAGNYGNATIDALMAGAGAAGLAGRIMDGGESTVPAAEHDNGEVSGRVSQPSPIDGARASVGAVSRPGSDAPAVEAPRPAQGTLPEGAERQAENVRMVPTQTIQVDPARFQFRVLPGEAGLGDAAKFDPDLAGTINVWRDPADGKVYVVNGHHRVFLAKKLGVPDMQAPGPGARTIGATGEGQAADPLGQLADAMLRAEPGRAEAGVPPGAATIRPGALGRATGAIRDFFKPIPRAYERQMEQYSGTMGERDQDADRFIRGVAHAVPNLSRQNAIMAWAEAGGDDAALAKQAGRLKAEGKPAAKYYEIAQRLTPDEQAVGHNVRNYLDEMHAQAKGAGVIKGFRENYIPRVTDTAERSGAKQGQALARFAKSTRHGMGRQFPTRFDAEMAGYKPRWNGMQAISDYSDSVTRAIATRELQNALLNTKAEDGRPFLSPSGMGRTVKEDGEPSAHLALPFVKPEEREDYAPVNHPAFRKFTYAGSDEEGHPILTEGPLVAHPSIAGHLRRVMEPSLLQNDTKAAALGRAALRANTLGKKLLFGFSPMHMVSEGSRAEAFGANPFGLPDLDFQKGSVLDRGMHHGLTLFRSQAPTAEGLTGEGVYDRVPVIGRAARALENEVWDYANRAKAASYERQLGRNLKRYAGRMPQDDIESLTAREVNNAFGGLNHMVMGRGRTFQDLLRLALIAPDFEEGNLRFALSALTPKGAAARRAFGMQSAQMYMGARMLNAALNHGQTYPDKPLSVVYKGREYDIRSMPTDLLGLIKNPQTTLGYRQSPVATLGTELATGRDQFGRPISVPRALLTSAERVLPIAAQGPLGLGGARNESMAKKFEESLGTSVGVHDYPYRTPAEAIIQQAAREQVPLPYQNNLSPQAQEFRRTVQALDAGRMTQGELNGLVSRGELSARDAARAIKESKTPMIVGDARQIPLATALEAYRVATPQERALLQPLLMKKYQTKLMGATQGEKAALQKMFMSAMQSKPEGVLRKGAAGFYPHWPLTP